MWSSEIHKQQLLLANPHTEERVERRKTALVVLDTSVSQERWLQRMAAYLSAESRLLWANRLRKLSSIAILVPALTLAFSLYVAPTLSEATLVAMAVLLVTGLFGFILFSIVRAESQSHRDAISRLFYESSHELEINDDGVTLIDRASYRDVAKVIFMDHQVGTTT
ncbi:hypothetical protein [Alteromonas sp. CYL-A6]|uniref:hypothetical protein n=1 Tax=Alteromonas nitratireducens TaxID=3390813 RepID=UPI0034B26D91